MVSPGTELVRAVWKSVELCGVQVAPLGGAHVVSMNTLGGAGTGCCAHTIADTSVRTKIANSCFIVKRTLFRWRIGRTYWFIVAVLDSQRRILATRLVAKCPERRFCFFDVGGSFLNCDMRRYKSQLQGSRFVLLRVRQDGHLRSVRSQAWRRKQQNYQQFSYCHFPIFRGRRC